MKTPKKSPATPGSMNIQTNAVLTEGLDIYSQALNPHCPWFPNYSAVAHTVWGGQLLCARIDALASDAAIEGASNRQALYASWLPTANAETFLSQSRGGPLLGHRTTVEVACIIKRPGEPQVLNR